MFSVLVLQRFTESRFVETNFDRKYNTLNDIFYVNHDLTDDIFYQIHNLSKSSIVKFFISNLKFKFRK